MEIDKILFGQLNSAGQVNNPFEDLDVNNDGKISEEDKSLAANQEIKDQIDAVLTSLDEEYCPDGNCSISLDEINDMLKENETSPAELVSASQETENQRHAELVSASQGTETLKQVQGDVKAENLTADAVDINKFTKEYEVLQAEKELLQDKYEQENAKLEEAQKLLDTYTKEYDDYQKEIEEVNNQILSEQNRQQVAQQEQMDSIINNAINSYDKEKDGDFNAYLQKTMDTKGYPVYSSLGLLTENAGILSDKAKTVLNNITIQSSIVANLKLSVKSVSIELDGINSQLKSISDTITANTNVNNANEVTEVSDATQVSDIAETQDVNNVQNVNNVTNIPSAKRKHVPMKTQGEYNEIIDNKYAELWEKFGGDSEKIARYTKDNMVDFADIDGDGRITLIDRQIYLNYYNSAQKLLTSSSCEWKEKGESYVKGKYFDYANLLRTAVGVGCNKNDLYDLEDLITYLHWADMLISMEFTHNLILQQ